MESIRSYKSSLYCWIILTIFIGGTMVFMVNFYQKAVDEISGGLVVNVTLDDIE